MLTTKNPLKVTADNLGFIYANVGWLSVFLNMI